MRPSIVAGLSDLTLQQDPDADQECRALELKGVHDTYQWNYTVSELCVLIHVLTPRYAEQLLC